MVHKKLLIYSDSHGRHIAGLVGTLLGSKWRVEGMVMPGAGVEPILEEVLSGKIVEADVVVLVAGTNDIGLEESRKRKSSQVGIESSKKHKSNSFKSEENENLKQHLALKENDEILGYRERRMNGISKESQRYLGGNFKPAQLIGENKKLNCASQKRTKQRDGIINVVQVPDIKGTEKVQNISVENQIEKWKESDNVLWKGLGERENNDKKMIQNIVEVQNSKTLADSMFMEFADKHQKKKIKRSTTVNLVTEKITEAVINLLFQTENDIKLVILCTLTTRYDLSDTAIERSYVDRVNRNLVLLAESFPERVALLDLTKAHRLFHTKHGLHFNTFGKEWFADRIAHVIFTSELF